MIRRETVEDALENDRCGICGSVDHFREGHPMTVTDRTAATAEEFAARIAPFESAPTPPEVREAAVLEEVARAMHESVCDCGQGPTLVDRRMAAAAVAAYRATQDGGECTADHCDQMCEEVIRERDRMEEIADQLAYAVAPIEVIGEHSSANSPWQNALDLLRERAPLATQDGGAEEAVRPCMCGRPEADSVHHRPQASDEEHPYEAAPTEAEYYGGDVLHADVCEVLNALNLGAYARPYSTHDVVQRDILPAIRAMQDDRKRLEDFAIAMINAPDDSAADWGYELAHFLDGDR